ncbi:MAG TPA: SRPBCC family protein [Puia sp.]|nr:SRPBCC family protein [Puia sp.]
MQLHTHPDTADGIGEGERVLSAIGGSLLVYYVTKKHKADTLLLLGGAYLLYRAIAGHCPIRAAWKTNYRRAHPSNVNVRTQVIVNKPREEVYAFWRSLENWPLFMRHLGNVDELDNTTSAWTMKMPGIGEVRWEARIVKEEKDTELSWTSVPGTPIDVTGKINFSSTPGNATRIDVMLSYRAPAGIIGERISRLLTPSFQGKLEADIHNFKHYIEDLGKTGD